MASLFVTCSNNKVANTVSDTDTGKAKVYNPDLTAAVGATVKIFNINDTTQNAILTLTTDDSGYYSFVKLPYGSYNVLITKGGLVAFQDSVLVYSGGSRINPDTLGTPGSVTGIVGVQPNHDPSTATVQILGSDIFSNVDQNGRFTLKPVVKGTYTLRLATTQLEYTPTFMPFVMTSNINDTLKDTLWLKYTGIPVVTGLTASCDTVNGVVRLSWNKTSYRNFQDYLVFRDPYDSIYLSAKAIAARTDTFFIDTIFKRSAASAQTSLYKTNRPAIGPYPPPVTVSNQFSFSDTNDYHYKYRVCVENNSGNPGETYKYVDVIAASPTKAITTIAFSAWHIAKGFITSSASINDTILFAATIKNQTRRLKSVTWIDAGKDATVRTRNLDTTMSSAVDSLKYVWADTGIKKLICRVTDMAGYQWNDTTVQYIVIDPPTLQIYTPHPTVAVQDTLYIHAKASDKFGRIVKMEWDIGNTGIFTNGKTDSTLDTFIIAPASPDSAYTCAVRATDDDGNVVNDSIKIPITVFKLLTDSAVNSPRTYHSSLVFANKQWLIAGNRIAWGYDQQAESDVWNSDDGRTWVQVVSNAPFSNRQDHINLDFTNKMWVIGGRSSFNGGYQNDVWSSQDGTTWILATPAAGFSPRIGSVGLVFDNKLWIIAGRDYSGKLDDDIWNSQDGVSWNQVILHAGFSARYNLSGLVFNNKIWVVGGQDSAGPKNDVWCSEDGIAWNRVIENSSFSPRSNHSTVAFNDKMWVIAGEDVSGLKSDIWYSSDGSQWYRMVSDGGFPPRCHHTSVVFNNKVWVVGGGYYFKDWDSIWYAFSDVWCSSLALP
jgi:hypothetical protein